MGLERRAGDSVADRFRSSIGRERSPQALLDALVAILREPFTLFRASIRTVVEGTPMVEIAALWCAGETALTVGTRMSAQSTALAEIRATGRPQVRDRIDPEESLVEQVMAQEGIRSYVTLPLREGTHATGLLSFSSRIEAAFTDEDVRVLEELAGIVGDTLQAHRR